MLLQLSDLIKHIYIYFSRFFSPWIITWLPMSRRQSFSRYVGGCSALRDPICYSFLLCVVSQGFSIPYQFLENRSEQSYMQFSGLRSWERAPARIPFSDSLQWLPSVTLLKCNLFSYALLVKISNAFWPFEDCYLLGFVFFFQLFFYCLNLPCMKIYKNKAPLFHSRFGSPESLFSPIPVPRSWSTKTVT